jgi:hypothetical protein
MNIPPLHCVKFVSVQERWLINWRTHCFTDIELRRADGTGSQPGKKRIAREQRNWELFAFPTIEANEVVKPFHEKAMPVILTDPVQCREWLGGGEENLRLQRPYSANQLVILK